ncbi:OmpH family outer membrane protein [Marinomonas sp. 15G1-11]|uniref:OmpH family outer membrane protein n=1 Tax=Marinomonas phaeophyticola TaxID=3004091 RepID=A0ABT4JVW3_9GAMM|nr:OmpH family outer membrane protein [Marinomonas sp. 15G1-11]MCZ2721709.1 OmpH family outer membrane protein [Marinomonas sp. 15G1-11]
MKNVFGLVFGLMLSFSSFATEVAVIDFRGALLQSDKGQAAAVEPRKQVRNMENQLNSARKELDDFAKNLKKEELTIAPEEYQKRLQELNQRDVAIRNMAANMQRQAKQMEQELVDSLSPAAEVILKDLIAEKKLDLVLNRQLSLYANAGVDLTAEFVKRLNGAK